MASPEPLPRAQGTPIRLGERPVEHLRKVLESARQGRAGQAFLVLTHKSPDPDALGSLCGVQALLAGMGYEAVVATVGRIRRAENVAMVRELKLSFDSYEEVDLGRFAGALLVDSQPGFGHTVVPDDVPLLAVFDHHKPPEEVSEQSARVPHFDVRENVGATSSLVYEYMRDAGLELDEHTASALFCGIRYDTADLSTHLSPLDERAYFGTLRRADRGLVARIQHPALPAEYYGELDRALRMSRKFGPLVVGLFGEVKNPESVAEMADFLLRMEGCSWALAGGAYEGVYYVSVRSDYTFGPAYGLLERVLGGQGSFGGHGRVAGGQVQLEDGGPVEVRRLERTIRDRALSILERRGANEEDLRLGLPIV